MKYDKKEMVLDCIRDKSVIVFETDCYLTALDTISKRIKNEFPEIFKILTIKAINGSLFPGDSIIIKVRGYSIAVLITQERIFGSQKDEPEQIHSLTIDAIKDMLKQLEKSSADNKYHFVSGILNRRIKNWKNIESYITRNKLNWSVYTE